MRRHRRRCSGTRVTQVGPLAVIAAALLGAACGLAERSDVLLGRSCLPDRDHCDPGQTCLPHAFAAGAFSDYFCRDEASFSNDALFEAPPAYCDAQGSLRCPGRLTCRADRIRVDGGPRSLVCKSPEDPFAPPDEGSSG